MADDAQEHGYDTPEEAARGDIPPRYARALSVSVSPDGDEAIVVLGTNEEPYVYPYEVSCLLRKTPAYAGVFVSVQVGQGPASARRMVLCGAGRGGGDPGWRS